MDSLLVVVPREGAGLEETGKARMLGTQISLDANCALLPKTGHKPRHAGAVVGLLASIKLQQQRSLLLRILVRESWLYHCCLDAADALLILGKIGIHPVCMLVECRTVREQYSR